MIAAIRTENLTKIYDDTIVVDHLTFQVKKGEIVSLLGPNGAGKSTIIKMLTTLLKPDAGSAFINEYNILKEQKNVRKSISITPQELVFYEELTAIENLIFFGTMHDLPKKKLKEESRRILMTLGLSKRQDKVKNFSGGMKRRLNLAINLIMNTEILFLDEPTAGLDPQSQHIVWKLLQGLKKEGKTIILTTHDMHEAEILSDNVLIIDNGRIIAIGSPKALKAKFSKKNILEIVFKNHYHFHELRQKIKSLEFVQDVIDNQNNKVSVFFDGGIINLIKILDQQIIMDIIEIESMNLRQTTLEDVFLNLTGKRLQE
ncbi:MAG: ABC transporter ATP-binding protein [Candidatus Hodarchaeales archaeon]